MKTRADYVALEKRLDDIAKETGAYITDSCIDRENVLVDGMTEDNELIRDGSNGYISISSIKEFIK